MNIPRFGFIKQKKGVWDVMRISTGPWVQYEDVEKVVAEKDARIKELESKLTKEGA